MGVVFMTAHWRNCGPRLMNETPSRKRALVTGGSGGIGSAICRRLASDGFSVIVHANNNLAGAQALAAELMAAGGRAQAVAIMFFQP